ncbi:hypothetical protein [Virgibacillus pantothenticus]|uniref:hypothetical protein n=1 Tax=Virgibacillus pantothenticus TaxID=1473 RepID=UPI0009854A2B|nr:hypothetical protein [Virgibacillus pantothenticus]
MTNKAAGQAREVEAIECNVTADNWGKHVDISEALTGLKAEQEHADSMKIDFDSLKGALKSYVETQNKYDGYHDISFDKVFEILNGYNNGNWRISDYIIHATTKTSESGVLTYGDDQFVIVRFTSRGGDSD